MPTMWYVYVLYSVNQNRFYVGLTSELKRRILEHKRGGAHATARMGNIKLVYYEVCTDKGDAMNREKSLKTGFGRSYLRKRLSGYLNRTRSSAG